MIYASGLHRRWELRRMRRLLSTASAIVAVSTEGAKRVRARMSEFADRPVVSIPNGFDGSDFDDLPPPQRNDGVFRIVHTGSVYTDIGRRQRWLLRRLAAGSMPGVDILPHSHLYLLEAIERLIDRDRSLCSRIELLLVGAVRPKDREAAERSSVVRATGYVPHREAIALTRSADFLFLPMYNLAPGMRAATVPGKTYEYLAAQRPILAAVPNGDAGDILAQAGNAHLCAPDDVEGMSTAIEAQISGVGAVPATASPTSWTVLSGADSRAILPHSSTKSRERRIVDRTRPLRRKGVLGSLGDAHAISPIPPDEGHQKDVAACACGCHRGDVGHCRRSNSATVQKTARRRGDCLVLTRSKGRCFGGHLRSRAGRAGTRAERPKLPALRGRPARASWSSPTAPSHPSRAP